MIFVEAAVFDTLHHFLRVNMILLVDDLHDRVLDDNVLALEVDEVCPRWLMGQTELAGP